MSLGFYPYRVQLAPSCAVSIEVKITSEDFNIIIRHTVKLFVFLLGRTQIQVKQANKNSLIGYCLFCFKFVTIKEQLSWSGQLLQMFDVIYTNLWNNLEFHTQYHTFDNNSVVYHSRPISNYHGVTMQYHLYCTKVPLCKRSSSSFILLSKANTWQNPLCQRSSHGRCLALRQLRVWRAKL